MRRPRSDNVLLAVAVMPLCLVAALALLVVPQFKPMYASFGFGADLPLATRLLLATYHAWILIPILLAIVWVATARVPNRAPVLMVLGLLMAGGLFAFMLYSCYAPILDLANVV